MARTVCHFGIPLEGWQCVREWSVLVRPQVQGGVWGLLGDWAITGAHNQTNVMWLLRTPH